MYMYEKVKLALDIIRASLAQAFDTSVFLVVGRELLRLHLKRLVIVQAFVNLAWILFLLFFEKTENRVIKTISRAQLSPLFSRSDIINTEVVLVRPYPRLLDAGFGTEDGWMDNDIVTVLKVERENYVVRYYNTGM